MIYLQYLKYLVDVMRQNNIPDVIELTYVNKNYFETPPELNTQPLPIPNLDYGNSNGSDYNLNFYPFTKH